MSSDVVEAGTVAIGERIAEPWSGVVAVIQDTWQGPRKAAKPSKAEPYGVPELRADECALCWGHPGNCVVKLAKTRLMRRMLEPERLK